MIDLPAVAGPDDALAQPTRARLFALLSESGHPAGTAELAEHLGLHPNGVRTHLERLQQSGLVVHARPLQRRGRPPDAWMIAPDARPGGRAPSAYQDLGRWLARALGTGPGALGSIERTGRQIGHELPAAGAPHDPDVLQCRLAALGFEPTVTLRGDDRLTLRLRNCPYRTAVHENQPAVCALHKGITRGLLDVLLPHAKLERFEPHDPDQAGCEIDIQGIQPPAVEHLVKS